MTPTDFTVGCMLVAFSGVVAALLPRLAQSGAPAPCSGAVGCILGYYDRIIEWVFTLALFVLSGVFAVASYWALKGLLTDDHGLVFSSAGETALLGIGSLTVLVFLATVNHVTRPLFEWVLSLVVPRLLSFRHA